MYCIQERIHSLIPYEELERRCPVRIALLLRGATRGSRFRAKRSIAFFREKGPSKVEQRPAFLDFDVLCRVVDSLVVGRAWGD